MPTPKKDGHYLNVYMDHSLYDQLQKFCKENGVSKTFAVETGVKMYLEKQEKLREK